MSETDLRHVRQDYDTYALARKDLQQDPLDQFQLWLQAAEAHPIQDVTSMSVATASSAGMPTVRTILLKHFDADGFCWYTDKRSPQGIQIAGNPVAELLFFWREQSRQVRISGTVIHLPDAQDDQYFNARPAASQYSASASAQSSVIASREAMQARVDALEAQYPEGEVPRPAEWGGFCLKPESFEFWQGRTSRLHDRFRYSLQDGDWLVERLCP